MNAENGKKYAMNSRSQIPYRRRHMAGAGLIEVLIAVLVLAIGLLGIAAMQATALRNSQSSLERSQGVISTYSIMDAMRANLDAAKAFEYNTSASCDVSGSATLAENDIAFWQEQLEQNLGEDACGTVDCNNSGLCLISVTWDDTRGAGGVDDIAFELEARL